MPPKLKKTLKWTGIGLGSVIVILGGVLGAMWAGTGDKYQGSILELVPARNALLVVKLDQPATSLNALANQLDELFGQRKGVRLLEESPLWRGAVGADKGSGTSLALTELSGKVRSLMTNLEKQLASAPGGLMLGQDILVDEAVAAVFQSGPKADSDFLLLTRCSDTLEFGWKFRSFGTGTYGSTTIETSGDNLQITTKGETLYVAQHLDTLVISSNESLVSSSLGLMDDVSTGFAALPQMLRAAEALKKQPSRINIMANLEQVRAVQEKDKDGLVGIDRIFTLPSEVLQLSPEIMPTIRTVFERSIDTRAFDAASWSINLEGAGQAQIHQFLTGDDERLKKDFPQLVPAWTFEAKERAFLNILPPQTWFIATMRQPFKEIRASAKPNLDENGKPKESAVYSFLQAVGEDPKIDSIGLAFLDQHFALDPERDRAYMPPGVVSSVAFPPFALFMHWPGVTTKDALALMEEQLRMQGAKKVFVETESIDGDEFITFKLSEASDLLNWLTQFSCFAVNDHLVFSFSRGNEAVKAIFEASRSPLASMRGQADAPFRELSEPYNALVSLTSKGFQDFTKRAKLANALGSAIYSSTNPYGKSLGEWRREMAKEKNLDITDERLDTEIEELRRKWQTERAPFEARADQNFTALGAIRDFTAQTTMDGATMHTHFIIRMAE